MLPRDVFRELLDHDPSLRDALLAGLAHELRRVTGQVEELHFLDLAGRLAMRLSRLARDADPTSDEVRLDWPYTQSDLASMIGGTRQSVNKLLSELVDDGPGPDRAGHAGHPQRQRAGAPGRPMTGRTARCPGRILVLMCVSHLTSCGSAQGILCRREVGPRTLRIDKEVSDGIRHDGRHRGYSVRRGGGGETRSDDDDVEGHVRKPSASDDDDVEGHVRKPSASDDDDVEGHVRKPSASDDDDVEGHVRKPSASDDDDVEGHVRKPSASDDDDVEGHVRKPCLRR